MSGKLFVQIVILIIIAAVAFTAVKIGAKCTGAYGWKGMHGPKTMQQK